MSGSPFSIPKAKAGKLSVTRFNHRSCMALRGTGNFKSILIRTSKISPMLQESKKKTNFLIFGGSWIDTAKELFSMINTGVLSVGIISSISSILTLILIYFSIALSRVSIRNKKIGGVWFIIFLVLNAIAGYIALKMSSAIPYFLNLNGFKILHFYELNILPGFNNGVGNILIFGNNYNAYINIIGFLSHIVMSVAAFLGTGYLIEKKIDL